MTSNYDNQYKKLFSNPVLVKELFLSFINEELVKELDYDSLEKLDKSFITEEFIDRESDILYRINFKGKDLYIYLLIEFQSTVDRFMALRMLRYITEFYEYLVYDKKVKTKRLPPVFPVLLYNGVRRWTAPESFGKLIERTIPDLYIPEFRYYKIAENEFSQEILLGIKNIVSAIFFIESTDNETLLRGIKNVVNLIKNERPEDVRLFRNWIKSYFHGINEDAAEEIKDTIIELQEVETMLAATLKKRDKQNLKLGLERGKQDVLIMLINKKFGITKEEKSLIRNIKDLKRLDIILEKMISVKSKDGILKYLK